MGILKGMMLIGDHSDFEKEFAVAKGLFTEDWVDMAYVELDDVEVSARDSFDGRIRVGGEEHDLPDFVVVMTVEERSQYQLKAVLRMFETLGVVCVNTYDSIEAAGDKLYSFQLAKRAVPELGIPDTVLVTDRTDPERLAEMLGFPMVLKVMHGFQGRGVSLVRDMHELRSMIGMLTAAEYGDQVIAQEAVMSSKGRDLRVVVAAGEVVTAFVRHNEDDFKSNLHQGGSIEPFVPPTELAETSVRLADAFGLKMGSIDYLFGEREGEFLLCEVNSIPGISYLFRAQAQGDTALVSRFMDMPKAILRREGLL